MSAQQQIWEQYYILPMKRFRLNVIGSLMLHAAVRKTPFFLPVLLSNYTVEFPKIRITHKK